MPLRALVVDDERPALEELRYCLREADPTVEVETAATAGRTVLVDLPEIRYAEARDDVVYVRTYDRVYPTRFSLHELERRLPTPPFLRIHRAFLANMRNVVEIRPYFNGTYLLKVNDATVSD